MKMIELKKAFGSMPFNGLIALILAAVVGTCLQSCDNKSEQEEEKRMEASMVRYGDPNVIITDKDSNPIPGPNGGSLRASDIPTNPNINFALRNSIADMAKTLGLECPNGKILYAILFGDKQVYIDFKSTYYSPYVFDENDKSKGEWGTLREEECLVTQHSDQGVQNFVTRLGTWVDGRPALSLRDSNGDVRVYIKTPDGVEIYDYGSEKLLGYLEKGSNPNTYKRTMYKFEMENGRHETNIVIGETVEEVPVGFIFVEQPEDNPSSVFKNSIAYINYRDKRTLANAVDSFDPKQRSLINSLNTVY
jgi:hypothetical protein